MLSFTATPPLTHSILLLTHSTLSCYKLPLSHSHSHSHAAKRNRPFLKYCFSTGGFVLRCKNKWESEGNFDLEAEILEFMKNSKNPEAFPSKKELIDAGRLDLVEGIRKQGGWLLMGWDLELANSELREEMRVEENLDWDNLSYSTTFERYGSCVNSLPLSLPSSSGRSLETAAVDDFGIEGILNRLEKERNVNFGFGAHIQNNDPKHELFGKTLSNTTVAGLKHHDRPDSLNHYTSPVNDSGCRPTISSSFSNGKGLSNSLKPNAWRSWSIQRGGFSDMEFEAGEIGNNETKPGGEMDSALRDETLELREVADVSLYKEKDNSAREGINQIKSRLQHLGSELSSVLQSLKSNSVDSMSEKASGNLADDLVKLSDALEFQENEILNAQDKLRSIRAKLAVLEGKMALAMIDAQKMVEDKQKRIDDAHRALRRLRTTCIVWPNTASEVLLAGSFDGWTTQRKMEKSRTGVFSLYLKLYPGQYEIKFIVDGEWRIDPLRPVVNNDGYENNLLIVTQS